jgi:hypothetical protein
VAQRKKIKGGIMPYKITGQNIENMYRRIFPSRNPYDIPEMDPCNKRMDNIKWYSFNEREKITDHKNSAVHFFIEDYQFNAIWTYPDRYVHMLKRLRAVTTPDFSVYTDMPEALKIYPAYRKQWIGKYWQEKGINVISSMSWPVGHIKGYTFAGIPAHTIIATSFVGEFDEDVAIEEFKESLKYIKPSQLFIKTNTKREYKLRKQNIDFEKIKPYIYQIHRKDD